MPAPPDWGCPGFCGRPLSQVVPWLLFHCTHGAGDGQPDLEGPGNHWYGCVFNVLLFLIFFVFNAAAPPVQSSAALLPRCLSQHPSVQPYPRSLLHCDCWLRPVKRDDVRLLAGYHALHCCWAILADFVSLVHMFCCFISVLIYRHICHVFLFHICLLLQSLLSLLFCVPVSGFFPCFSLSNFLPSWQFTFCFVFCFVGMCQYLMSHFDHSQCHGYQLFRRRGSTATLSIWSHHHHGYQLLSTDQRMILSTSLTRRTLCASQPYTSRNWWVVLW